ncbi:MAG: restriction endonuclease subunit S [Hyphomonadaceae bacterium]
MNALPAGWDSLRLKDVAARGSTIDPSRHPNEQFELYSVPSYSDGEPELAYGREIGSTKQEVRAGDVLLCKIIPHLVRVWVVPEPQSLRQIASSEWIIYRDHGCDPNYLRRALMEPNFREQFMQTKSGVGGSLTRARPVAVNEIEVSLAPLGEQRRIVAKLEQAMARTARARAELARIPSLVGVQKQAILAQAFSGALTARWREENRAQIFGDELRRKVSAERARRREAEGVRGSGANRSIPMGERTLPSIPDGWAWMTFDECSWDLTVGHVGPMKDRYVASGIPFLRSLNVKTNAISRNDLVFISQDFHRDLRKSQLKAGTIVVVRTGEPGVAAVIPEELDGSNCSDLVICRAVESVDPHYASRYINSDFAKKFINDNQVGVAQQHFNVGAMSQLPFPLAPPEEQVEIVRRIDSAFAWLDKVAHEHAQATRLLDPLDQALLAKAFRGELVPQDPADEPAAALLARVRAEREGAAPPARKRKARA